LKKILFTLILGIFTLVISTAFLITGNQGYTGPATTTIYVYPATITATAPDQNFTIEIRIQNVTDLYTWSIGLVWNSSALECLNFNPDYSFFGPKEYVMGIDGTINNIAGEIYPAYAYTLTTDTGVTGSGTLANATFRSKAAGTFNVNLAEPGLSNSNIETIPINMVGVFTAIWDSVAYPVITVSKLTNESDYAWNGNRCRIYNHAFNQPEMMISFNVAIPLEAIGPGSCNVTIPKTLLRDNATHPWHIYLDTTVSEIGYVKTENATYTSLYFTYPVGNHKIMIRGAEVIPEFPTAIITLSLLIIITLTAALLRKMAWPTKRQEPTVTQQTS